MLQNTWRQDRPSIRTDLRKTNSLANGLLFRLSHGAATLDAQLP